MKSYLSIDLDYFTGIDYGSPERYKCLELVNKALDLCVPTVVVDTHHGLTKHVNRMGEKFGLSHLINIDYHDDIVCEYSCGLTEGSWVTNIDWRYDGVYEWRLPSYYECVDRARGVCDLSTDLFYSPNRSGWFHALRKEGYEDINWKDIKAVGICVSGFWLYPDALSERNFNWNKPHHSDSYDDLKEMYEEVICKLTNQNSFDEAFWLAMSSYDPDNTLTVVECDHFWLRRLMGNRDNSWTNPAVKYVSDTDLLMNRYKSLLKKYAK